MYPQLPHCVLERVLGRGGVNHHRSGGGYVGGQYFSYCVARSGGVGLVSVYEITCCVGSLGAGAP